MVRRESRAMAGNEEPEPRVLETVFKVLTMCGCWRPDSWMSRRERAVYGAYTFLMLLLVCTFTLTQFIDTLLTVDNADDFSDGFCISLAMILACYKMFTALMIRASIARLAGTLKRQPCKPLSASETEIYRRFERNISANTRSYATLCLMTCAIMGTTSLLTEFGERRLTYRAWFPFDYNYSTALFCLLYVHQLVGLTIGAMLNVASDSLFCGLLLHVCCQYEILACRLKEKKKAMNERSCAIRGCVKQHCLIFRFALDVNATFRMAITLQFLMSMLAVCFNLYQLTKIKIGGRYIQIAMYMCCMLTQIFIYCWYGNEVKLKSYQLVDSIIEMDWLALNEDSKKSLIVMMARATLPIEITSFYLVSMNLDSFMGILKTSYSAYNLLQQTNE